MIIDCAAYVDGKRATPSLDLDDVRPWLRREDGFVWLGLQMPDHAEMTHVCRVFDLEDAIDVDETLAPHSRPVLMIEGPTTSVVLRTAAYEDRRERVILGEITVIVQPRFVITVRYGKASPMAGLRHELEQDPDQLRRGPLAVFAEIVSQVIDDYHPALDGFEQDAVEAERAVFDEAAQRPTRRLYLLKRQVRELLVAIDGAHEPLMRLTRIRVATHYQPIMDDLHEATEQLGRVVRRAESLSELLTTALDASLAEISVRQNEDMRRISAWVAIAAVPTAIAGIYGMNFEYMPELDARFGYPLALALMTAACLLLYRGFRKAGWL
ncbi:MAG: magnesium and cobalt transport protein CorA [Actinomycetota bacterium]|nr:magnesium and cobalt transport protein CorA [Actinomycetota bacterium]